MGYSLFELLVSCGGVAGGVCVLFYLLLRTLLNHMENNRERTEQRLTGIIDNYNKVCDKHADSTDKNTQALTELTVFLKAKNGH